MNSSLKPRSHLVIRIKPGGIKPRCVLSDPSEEPHLLRLRLGLPLPPYGCFGCGKQDSHGSNYHLYCATCDVQFHEGCDDWPRERTHPYHLQHPLSFLFYTPEKTLVSNSNSREFDEHSHRYELDDIIHGRCDWCGEGLQLRYPFYRCSLCGFDLCGYCSHQEPSLTITSPKNHPHPLTLFPVRLSSPCNACGLADAKDDSGNYPFPAYICLQCHYIVHECCLDLPRVIKITLHPQHRLSYTPYLPPGQRSCEVCCRSVDPKHGAYSCTRGCPYTLHSRCATNKYIWDEKELEWEPEEEEEHDDTEETQPFVRIGDNEIRHFSHDEHHLHLFEEDGSGREDQCEACVLPIDHSGRFYCCMPCRFFLHETCASLPRKMYHKLHRHRLVLDPCPWQQEYNHPLTCVACKQKSCGFMYRCEDRSCEDVFLDVRCASSFSRPYIHRSHQQHLLSIDFESYHHYFRCHTCCTVWYGFGLKCIDGCDFVMCIKCASLPDEVRYKFDDHPLTLSCGEEDADSDPYWCELCEKRLDPKKWFYTCHKCSITVHVHCVFGPSIYMKSGRSFIVAFEDKGEFAVAEIEIVRNNSSTRPICDECCGRCRETVFYKTVEGVYKTTEEFDMTSEGCFCSFDASPRCLEKHLREIKSKASK